MSFTVFGLAIILGYGLAVALHELGHAGAAWLLDIRVTRVQWGQGGIVAEWRVGDTAWSIGKRLSAGFVMVKAPSGRWARERYMLMIAAGPATNLLLVVWLVLGLRFAWEKWLNGGNTFSIGDVGLGLLVANLGTLFAAMRRDDAPIDGQPHMSDGKKLVTLLRHSPALYEMWRMMADVEVKARAEAKPATASERWDRIAERLPKAAYEAACRDLIASRAEGHKERLQWIDGLCTWALFTGDRDLLQRCEPFSAELFRWREKEWTIVGTRASVLLLLNRTAEGISMLEQLMAHDDASFDRAIGGCCLAWAAHRRGDRGDLERWWEESLRHNGGKPVIAWMARELAGTVPPNPAAPPCGPAGIPRGGVANA